MKRIFFGLVFISLAGCGRAPLSISGAKGLATVPTQSQGTLPTPTPTPSPDPGNSVPGYIPPPFVPGPPLFQASTGLGHGEILLEWQIPMGVAAIAVRRLPGNLPPGLSCNDGALVYQANAPAFASGRIDQTGAGFGEPFSYRLCAYTSSGQLAGSSYVANVHSRDAAAPLAIGFAAASGNANREILLSLTYPGDTRDYAMIRILRAPGSVPPADCIYGTQIAPPYYGPFPSLQTALLVDTVPSNGPFSYRVCIYDQFDNVNGNAVVAGIRPFDSVPPPPLARFQGALGAAPGSIQIGIASPVDFSDVAYFDIRRISGVVPPNAACTNGVAIAHYVAPFAGAITDDVSNINETRFSYRACVYDRQGNLTSSNYMVGLFKKGHYAFVTNESYTGDLGGLAGADQKCQAAAANSGGYLPAGLSYRAVLSDGYTSAYSRIAISKPVYSTGRIHIAANAAGFWSGALLAPLKHDQYGQDRSNLSVYNLRVWTNSWAAGAIRNAGNSASNCFNWTNGDADWGRKVGYLDMSNSLWMEAPNYDTADQRGHNDDHCDYPAHLYCISN